MIKAIIADVDGVIVGKKPGVNFPLPNEKVIKKLKELHKNGLPIVLCTAKYHPGIIDLIKLADLHGPHITSGGALVIDPLDNKIVKTHSLDNNLAQQIVTSCIKNNIYIECYGTETYFVEKKQAFELTKKHAVINEVEPKIVSSLEKELMTTDLVKIEAFAVAISLYFFVQVREPTIDSEHFSLKSYLDKLQDGVKDITKSRYILSLSLFYALVGAITFCFQIYFNQALLVSLGYSTIAMSLIFGGMRIFNISFLTKFMKQSKWFTFRNSILLFPLLMIVAYLPGIALTKYIALIFILVSMLVSTSRGIILNKYLNDEVSSKNRATSISLVNLILSLVFSAVSFSSSIVTNIQLIFTFYGLISLIVILPLGLLVIKNKD